MKGQRTVKYYLQIDTVNDYLSKQHQISCSQYWSEFDNCRKLMENHNKDCEEYEQFEYDEQTKEFDNYNQTTRMFTLIGTTVILTEIRCKEGYCFRRKR